MIRLSDSMNSIPLCLSSHFASLARGRLTSLRRFLVGCAHHTVAHLPYIIGSKVETSSVDDRC